MKRSHPARGVAALEFAILLVPLLLMVFGMTELGRVFHSYNTLLKSTRTAVRYLSMQPQSAAAENAARCLAVHGSTSCSGEALLPGLSTNMVQIAYEAAVTTCFDDASCAPPTGSLGLVSVTISNYPFKSFVPFVLDDMAFGPIVNVMRQGAS